MSVSSRIRALSRVAVTVAAVCYGAAVGPTAFAQTPPPTFSLNPLSVGDCRVVVTIEKPRGGDQVGVVADQTLVREQTVVAGGGTLTFGWPTRFVPASAVVVRVNGVEATGKDGKPLPRHLGKDAKGGRAARADARPKPSSTTNRRSSRRPSSAR